mmetsp:Transcript_19916/g.40996  ORF Transcript_19916/g.40996 Transcript_19916/m.40996 type:complete len:230 (+) Transcript_19916:347-1036(+)
MVSSRSSCSWRRLQWRPSLRVKVAAASFRSFSRVASVQSLVCCLDHRVHCCCCFHRGADSLDHPFHHVLLLFVHFVADFAANFCVCYRPRPLSPILPIHSCFFPVALLSSPPRLALSSSPLLLLLCFFVVFFSSPPLAAAVAFSCFCSSSCCLCCCRLFSHAPWSRALAPPKILEEEERAPSSTGLLRGASFKVGLSRGAAPLLLLVFALLPRKPLFRKLLLLLLPLLL